MLKGNKEAQSKSVSSTNQSATSDSPLLRRYPESKTPVVQTSSTVFPLPSVSCKSTFSTQTFHTAVDEQEEEQNELDKPQLERIVERRPLKMIVHPSSNSGAEGLIINRTSQLIKRINTNDFGLSYHPTSTIPMTASTSNNSMMANHLSLIHSMAASIPSNYYYYGSLDNGFLSRSPAGSYFPDNYSEDYEVVLDDGTRQKRSVSLSTLPPLSPLEPGRKHKGNYNHLYYIESNELSGRNEDTDERNQAEEFYQFLLADEERRTRLATTASSDPSVTVQNLQPDTLSDDSEDEYYQTLKKRYKARHEERAHRTCNYLKDVYAWLVRHSITLSHKQKMVLKCSFAYLLGSLFTFVPFFHNFLGSAKLSSHVIATVTVFFLPSKTVGGMVEAAGFGLLYTLCAIVVSLLSMLVAIYLRSEGYYVTSCCVTLGFWLAGSTFVLSFIKAYYNKPTIGTGCGLGFMIIFPVLVREGMVVPAEFDPTYMQEMFAIVTIGTALSVFVCWFIWPMTATKQLKSDINDTLMAIRILLKLLTKTFLLDTDLPEFTANENLQNAINSHRTSFTSLQSSLEDAKKEFYNLHIWQHAAEYDTIVSSLQRLAQHIGGLRSSCGLQFEVMKTGDKNRPNAYGTFTQPQQGSSDSKSSKKKGVYHIKPTDQRKKLEYEMKREQTISSQSIANRSNDFNETESNQKPMRPSLSSYYDFDQPSGEDGALVQFIKTVRRPMKSLAFTCKQTIVHLQSRFTGQTTDRTPSFALLRQNLAMAMSIFEESQQLALTRMYQRKMKNASKKKYTLDPKELQSHLMTQFPAEDVFLVYFFVFCLLEFAKELLVLVECVQSVFEEEERKNDRSTWFYINKYLIQPFWFVCCCFFTKSNAQSSPYEDHLAKINQLKKKSSIDTLVPNNNNTLNTLHTPKPKTKIRRFFLNLWGFFSWFRKHTVRYGLKATFISVIIASLAFFPMTRDYFVNWKMDWMLITVTAVMSPTVGGTNQVAILRVLATMLGSIIAVLFYWLLPHDGLTLLFMTWAFSVPCFWVILNHKHGRFGMFSLLSYNLVVPYMYNHQNEDPPVDLIELAFMRCATVSAGVIVGLFVTAYVWPFEARREMRKGLSDLLIRLSWLYKQLVSEYSEDQSPLTSQPEMAYSQMVKQVIKNPTDPYTNRTLTSCEELEALARRNEQRSFQFQQAELSLQVTLVELQGLLAHAPNEPRLKGPFPVKTYEAILESCQTILDKFLSIRIIILKDVWATQVRRDLMLPASQELMEMAGSVLLYFYLLASALQLKTPLPPYLPPAEQAREKLMLKLQKMPKIPADLKKNHDFTFDSEAVKDECYMVYYAYVVMMESIIIELDKLGQRMKELFGSLVPDEQWARCFGLTDIENDQRKLY
ncbi:Uncharacterized protein C26F1.08c [Choanephora cucurbitarum]|uniref:Uncharacterized protein C26F1.08c n=1 Tax=Choanephora cucurbitarum TaxID=101091 RepID=A0A1C7N7V5_9FUNG|nr:Uncharacterized protein C26F1.08c [Choanephora cucurbitarum]